MKSVVAGLLACLLASSAGAQTAERVPASLFQRDPSKYIDHQIRIDKLGCFSLPDGASRCTSYGGVYIVPGSIVPAKIKKLVDDNCGGLTETEEEPFCLFDVVLTPLAVDTGVGTIVKGDQSTEGPVWMVKAGAVTVMPHR